MRFLGQNMSLLRFLYQPNIEKIAVTKQFGPKNALAANIWLMENLTND